MSVSVAVPVAGTVSEGVLVGVSVGMNGTVSEAGKLAGGKGCVNVRLGAKGVGVSLLGILAGVASVHAAKMDPRSGKRACRMLVYLLLSRSSRSGMSCAARRRMSKAASVRRIRRVEDTPLPESASSSTLTMLPRSPLARRAQWESTERRSRRDTSKRRSWT